MFCFRFLCFCFVCVFLFYLLCFCFSPPLQLWPALHNNGHSVKNSSMSETILKLIKNYSYNIIGKLFITTFNKSKKLHNWRKLKIWEPVPEPPLFSANIQKKRKSKIFQENGSAQKLHRLKIRKNISNN